jgi:hypothetical protein
MPRLRYGTVRDAAVTTSLYAGDPWNDKPYKQWDEKDVLGERGPRRCDLARGGSERARRAGSEPGDTARARPAESPYPAHRAVGVPVSRSKAAGALFTLCAGCPLGPLARPWRVPPVAGDCGGRRGAASRPGLARVCPARARKGHESLHQGRRKGAQGKILPTEQEAENSPRACEGRAPASPIGFGPAQSGDWAGDHGSRVLFLEEGRG